MTFLDSVNSAFKRAQIAFRAGVFLLFVWALFFLNSLMFPGDQSEQAVEIMAFATKLSFAFSVFEYFEYLLFRKLRVTYQYSLTIHDHEESITHHRGGIIVTSDYMSDDTYQKLMVNGIQECNQDNNTDFDLRHIKDFRLTIISKDWK